MRIIHFSDFHLDGKRIPKSENNIVNYLITILKEINQQKKIDLILFTGDLINQGGSNFEDISLAFEKFKEIFIDKLCNSINLHSKQFIFTIGNHDVCRKKDNRYIESGLFNTLTNNDAVAELIDNEDSDNYIKRIVDFKAFEKEYYKKYCKSSEYKYSKFCSNFKLLIDGHLVGISALNTAWRCWHSDHDKNTIIMGASQIQNSLSFLEECEFKIAISHHHYTFLNQFEIDLVQNLLYENYDMYLCGHIHSPKSSYQFSPSGKIFEAIVRGILSQNINETNSSYKNGFNVVDYDFEKKIFYYSTYFQENGTFFKKDMNVGNYGVWAVPTSNSIKDFAPNNIIDKEIIPNLYNLAHNNVIDNWEVYNYIQSPLEYINEIIQGNQVPTFKPDDGYQDVIYDDNIKFIVAITAENPNLFLDPTIGFYMANCYAVSLIRHVNNFFKKNQSNSNLIPELKVSNTEECYNFYNNDLKKRRENILRLLKKGRVLKDFEFIRIFMYDKKQGVSYHNAVFPSLKASQDLFGNISFFIEKEKMKESLSKECNESSQERTQSENKKNKWERFQEINKRLYELYNECCEKSKKAREVQKDRIENTVPEFLFVFGKNNIGIHTYLGGMYYPKEVKLRDVNGKLIKELIKLMAEYVDEDKRKGQLWLEKTQINKNHTFIYGTWSNLNPRKDGNPNPRKDGNPNPCEDGVVEVQL